MEEKDVVHSFDGGSTSMMNKSSLIIFAVVILLGIGTGYFLSQKSGSYVASKKSASSITSDTLKPGQLYGVTDEKTFKDSAEGLLKAGGIEGEGDYHLERPGGDSQNVYLTSSSIDLSKFVGKKVKVWGQTNTAEKAGWLMDVGRLQIQ